MLPLVCTHVNGAEVCGPTDVGESVIMLAAQAADVMVVLAVSELVPLFMAAAASEYWLGPVTDRYRAFTNPLPGALGAPPAVAETVPNSTVSRLLAIVPLETEGVVDVPVVGVGVLSTAEAEATSGQLNTSMAMLQLTLAFA